MCGPCIHFHFSPVVSVLIMFMRFFGSSICSYHVYEMIIDSSTCSYQMSLNKMIYDRR